MRRSIVTKMIVSALIVAGSLLITSVGQADDTLNEVTTGISKNNERIYKSTQTSSNSPLGTITYPTVTKVIANNTRDGSITSRTTTVKMILTGSFSTGSSGIIAPTPYYINTLNFSSMNAAVLVSGTSPDADDWVVATGNTAGKTNTINMKTTSSSSLTVGFDNDLAWWQLNLIGRATPFYLGFYATTTVRPTMPDYFSLIKVTAKKNYLLTPTITNTGLKDTDTVITGKGTFEGDVIKSNVSDTTVKVGSDLTYKLDVGSNLQGKDSVTVTETGRSDDDPGTTTAAVASGIDLQIASTNPDVTLMPTDSAKLKDWSDQAVTDWLVTQAGITATDKANDGNDAITFATDKTNLGTALSGLKDGENLTVPIYAVKKSVKSALVNVVITKNAGQLTFSNVPATVDFGQMTIPSTEKLFSPKSDWQVHIKDTRATGSNWYVYATATEFKSATHTLSGGLVYQDSGRQTSLTNQSVLVASGTSENDDDQSISTSWSSSEGIFLAAQPGIYTGSYSGSINWNLQDIPAK